MRKDRLITMNAPAIFTPEALQKVIASATPFVPQGHKMAVVCTVDSDGAQAVVNLHSKGDVWTVGAAYKHDWNGDNAVGADVVWSPF